MPDAMEANKPFHGLHTGGAINSGFVGFNGLLAALASRCC
jgi:hypothetical protein